MGALTYADCNIEPASASAESLIVFIKVIVVLSILLHCYVTGSLFIFSTWKTTEDRFIFMISILATLYICALAVLNFDPGSRSVESGKFGGPKTCLFLALFRTIAISVILQTAGVIHFSTQSLLLLSRWPYEVCAWHPFNTSTD